MKILQKIKEIYNLTLINNLMLHFKKLVNN